MDERQMSGNPPDTEAPRQARRDLRKAWISVVLVPIGYAVAMLLGEAAIGLLGYAVGGDRVAPTWVNVMIAVPVILTGILAGALATIFGLRARRAGMARGLVPAVIGALVVLYWTFKTVAEILRSVF